MENKKIMIGSWITLGHFSVAEVMADAGFDWLCVDLEHSVIDYYEAEHLIAAIHYKGAKPYVRVGTNDSTIIKRVLDAGAEGIIVPMVNSREDAVRAVNAVKYPPRGQRGVGLARAQRYGFGFEEYVQKFDLDSRLIVQIEHIDAIGRLGEILAVDGVYGSMIGPYDLSGSMGKPGRYDEPDVKAALEEYEKIGMAVNKPIGFHVIQPDYALVIDKIKKGYTFIAFSLDVIFLGTICRQQIKSLKEGIL